MMALSVLHTPVYPVLVTGVFHADFPLTILLPLAKLWFGALLHSQCNFNYLFSCEELRP